VARAVFHGQRGVLRQRYREGQEEQRGALGLVVKAMVLGKTLDREAALTQVREEGLAVQAADVARFAPVGHQHSNVPGRSSCALSEAGARGQLRPLRNPDEPREDGEW
jgi:hypothetical protein